MKKKTFGSVKCDLGSAAGSTTDQSIVIPSKSKTSGLLDRSASCALPALFAAVANPVPSLRLRRRRPLLPRKCSFPCAAALLAVSVRFFNLSAWFVVVLVCLVLLLSEVERLIRHGARRGGLWRGEGRGVE